MNFVQLMRQQGGKIRIRADAMTVPWPEYADGLRVHEGINAFHVPDFIPDDLDAEAQHMLAWTSVILKARNRIM